MTRNLLLLVASLLAATTPARAQSGVNLYWDACGLDGGVCSKVFACDSNTGPPMVLHASVILPAELRQFAAASVIVDVFVAGGALPPWWQTASGQCRFNAINMSFDPVEIGNGNCPDIWQDTPNLSVFQPQPGRLGPDMVRLYGGAAVPPGSEPHWPADGAELEVCRVTIARIKSVGVGSCAGCGLGACVVIRECFLQQPVGVGDYRVINSATSRSVSWNGGSDSNPNCPFGGDCYTPAVNRTWGAIKSLYR